MQHKVDGSSEAAALTVVLPDLDSVKTQRRHGYLSNTCPYRGLAAFAPVFALRRLDKGTDKRSSAFVLFVCLVCSRGWLLVSEELNITNGAWLNI